MLTHFSWQAAVVGGIGLAMSSTAMALQLMREKGMNRSESGQLGFSVLLFQDLAVIPALALVPLLAGSADEHFDWMKIGMKVLAFVGMLIGGRYLLRPVFRFIAASGVGSVHRRDAAAGVGFRIVYGCAGVVDGARYVYCGCATGGK